MSYNYTCPKCKGHLMINDHIILSVKNKKGKQGLVMLEPNPGEYNIIKHSSLNFKKGEILEIYCPVCHYDLICIPEKNLAKVMLEEETGELLTILFSVVFGEKITHKISSKRTKSYSHGLDFENLSNCR